MLTIVKSCEGWNVKDEATGEILATECSLLSAAAIKAHLDSGAGPDPDEHTLAEPCDCCDKLSCVCESGGCEACARTTRYYATLDCSCTPIVYDGQHVDTEQCFPCESRATLDKWAKQDEVELPDRDLNEERWVSTHPLG